MHFIFHFPITYFTVGKLSLLNEVLATPLRHSIGARQAICCLLTQPSWKQKKQKQITLRQLSQNEDQEAKHLYKRRKRNVCEAGIRPLKLCSQNALSI